MKKVKSALMCFDVGVKSHRRTCLIELIDSTN